MESLTRSEPPATGEDVSRQAQKVRPPRRVFLRLREIPLLLVGVLRADAAASRRVLGARRGGRIGVFLGIAALRLAAPSWPATAGLAALHLAATLGIGRLRRPGGLGSYQRLRLSLWTGTSALLPVATLRLAWPDSTLPALIGLAAAQLILERVVRRVF